MKVIICIVLTLLNCSKKELTAPKFYQENQAQVDLVLETYADLAYHTYTKAYLEAKKMQDVILSQVVQNKQPSASDLEDARNSWIQSRAAYLLLEAFRFAGNPIDNSEVFQCDGAECEGLMNAWPLAENSIDAFILREKDMSYKSILMQNEQGGKDVKNHSLAVHNITGGEASEIDVKVGWHAIEYLLWGVDANDKEAGIGAKRLVSENFQENNPNKKTYLGEITKALVHYLEKLKNEWDPANPNNFRNSSFLKDEKTRLDSFTRIYKSLGKLITGELGAERLSVGLSSQNQENEHSCFSDNTKADFYYDFQGILNLWEGKFELTKEKYENFTKDSKGLKHLIEIEDTEIAKQISRKLKQNRDIFCLNTYEADPNYTKDCLEKSIFDRFDQVLNKAHSENSKLQQVEKSLILELKKWLSEAALKIGIGKLDFEV